MKLVADRFVITQEGRAIDLATGEGVVLVESEAGDRMEQQDWLARCDRFFQLRHRFIAPLIDYGDYGDYGNSNDPAALGGRRRRFEAWKSGAAWRGSPRRSARARRRAAAFFAARGLAGVGTSEPDIRRVGNGPVILPDLACGRGDDRARAIDQPVALDVCGLALVARPEVAALAEMFDETCGSAWRTAAVWGPEQSGVRTLMRQLARVARLEGFIPVNADLVGGAYDELLKARSLFVMHDERSARGWRPLLECSLQSARRHVILFAGRRERPGVHGFPLGLLTKDALAEAIEPRCVNRAARQRIDAAAGAARGLPGRFVERLWGQEGAAASGAVETGPLRDRRAPRSRAAEQPATYGGRPAPSDGQPIESAPYWPAPSQLAALRQRMDSAIGDLRRSCRAAADRTLRHTVGCLARRGDWTHAARGLVQLASVLAERGKPREVQRILDDAREYAVKAKDDGVLLELAILSGIVWTDLGKLDEAESVLRAAVTAAREQPDRSSAVSAGLALARCHFWRGRFLDAEGALAALETGPLCERASVRVAIAASRVAIGRGDLSLAVSKATAALDAAARLNDPLIMAQAAYAAAFSHLSVGDRTALATDLAGCLGAARAARDPLRALRARLLDAEGARRAGREGVAVALLKRVGRCSAALPATVGARCALLTDLLSSSSPAEVVKRHVAATGFGALALFAPAADSDGLARAIVDEGLEILACCQSAQDDATVLAEVCLRLKKSLNAASVAFFAADGSSPLVCDGSRLEPGIARRVCAAGQAIAPGLVNERIEGGAPVRYAGELVGALVGRWPLGAAHDPARASMILAMAAAAGGPAMAALKARQANVSKPGLAELLGVSAAIADVRQAVDRAASAPFAVLIEGESGSGKELVARALHRRSPRQSRPFCALNCAALPDDLVEAELFGHARGAFTGAVAERPGVFEESHTGTLFLDEIGELSARAQAKLLRVIQDGELRRVGENVPRRVDVRIVSATNRDLRQEVSAGRFRLDLLYRLDVIRIVVPPLRERREDVAVLVEQFWREAAGRVGSRSTLGAATVGLLARYDWPGNVRELQNVLAALAVRSPRRGVVPPTALPPAIGGGGSAATWRLDHARRTFDERFVRAALTRAGGRRARAAEELGLTRQGLTKLMTRLGISQA